MQSSLGGLGEPQPFHDLSTQVGVEYVFRNAASIDDPAADLDEDAGVR
jgi:hypothetical protein